MNIRMRPRMHEQELMTSYLLLPAPMSKYAPVQLQPSTAGRTALLWSLLSSECLSLTCNIRRTSINRVLTAGAKIWSSEGPYRLRLTSHC